MVVRYAYRADQAREIKQMMEDRGLAATIEPIITRGNHGRAGYSKARSGALIARPSYKITGHELETANA